MVQTNNTVFLFISLSRTLEFSLGYILFCTMNQFLNDSSFNNDTYICDSNASREGYENIDRVVPGLWGALIPLGVLGNGFVVYVMLR